jgi:hypothetical protein
MPVWLRLRRASASGSNFYFWHQPLQLSIAGLVFSRRQIGRWTKI